VGAEGKKEAQAKRYFNRDREGGTKNAIKEGFHKPRVLPVTEARGGKSLSRAGSGSIPRGCRIIAPDGEKVGEDGHAGKLKLS